MTTGGGAGAGHEGAAGDHEAHTVTRLGSAADHQAR